MIKLYNTLSRKKEVFKPITPGLVKVYTCGPTVYWYPHLGNYRMYVFADILRRTLEFNNLTVKHIINVTDVGHLTNDSDDGDDKVEEAAKREGKSAKEITRFYFDDFSQGIKRLNIKQPFKWTWATKHISEQIELVTSLEEKGYTYKNSDGIYFDTLKFSNYGKLSRKNLEDLQGGKRIKLGGKKNKTDFALWKFSDGKKRLQEWPSPWGIGFPGWHIECSAMATKYFGKHFDIHTGGIDHISIHHENEIAQSTCGYDTKRWVNYWMHGEFLINETGKISKSKGKIKRLKELVDEGVHPLAYRYFTFTAHYRKPLTYSEEAITSAANSYNRLREIISQIPIDKSVDKTYLKEFLARINDDLDMPGALAVLWKLVRDKNAKGKHQTIKKMDEVFALDLLKKEKVTVPREVQELVEKREQARNDKDYSAADELRNKLAQHGWIIKDTPSGPHLSKA